MESILKLLTTIPLFGQIGILILCVMGLWWGAERVIEGASSIARRFGIPEMIIGLTIVSIGSSLPEIFVNINAGLSGQSDVGVGNIIGSCFVQISFILGICVLVGGPMSEDKKTLKRDGLLVLSSILLLFLFGLNGSIGTLEGSILMSLYIAYMVYLLHQKHRADDHPLTPEVNTQPALVAVLHVFWGMFIVWISSETMLSIGIDIGREAGLNEGFIGLLSGIGTSIPELAISLIALLHHHNEMSVGNLLGSNITDPLLSLSIGAILAGGYTVSPYLLWTAIPIWFVASSCAIFVFWYKGKMTRPWGGILVGIYLFAFAFLL